MNVMAEAHKNVKAALALLGSSVTQLKGQYAAMFAAALKQAHKEYKAMQKPDLEAIYRDSKRVNTHELKEGDVILHHWCLFKLANRRVYTYPSDLQHDEKGTVQFDTECIFRGEDSAIPQGWIDREGGWTVQGNSRATWSLVQE